jgi:hypothetical protein
MRNLLISLMLALSLGGCVTTQSRVSVTPRVVAPKLPPIPARLNKCFKNLTPIPVQNMSGKELTLLLSMVRQSEVRKSKCGRDLIQWYETVRKSYGSK